MKKGLKKIGLLQQVAIGAVLGILAGYFSKTTGMQAEFLGDLFMNLIQMVIVPLIFPLIVLAIVENKDAKHFGKLALKAFVYFFAVTTILIVLSLLLGKWSGVGSGFQAGAVSTEALDGIAGDIDLKAFALSIVPKNIFQAFADGQLLPVIFFGILLGIALVSIGEKAEPVIAFFDSWSQAMFKIVNMAIAFAPIGVFGFLAYDVAAYGLGNLASLGEFVLWTYIGYLLVAFAFYPLLGKIFHVPYFKLLKETSDLSLLAFSTGSSSVVLPSLIKRLQTFGISDTAASFVVPLGYSFNLGGACVYISMALMFVVNVYGVSLSIGSLFMLVLFLTVITKSIATVPAGAVVVLLASAAQLNLPAEGVALLVSVDFFVNAGRTALNVVGNALAPAIAAQSELALDRQQDELADAQIK